MFCKYCGNELPKHAKFCACCGARVSVSAKRSGRKAGPAALALAGVLAIALIGLAALAVWQDAGPSGGAPAYVYITGYGEMMYMADCRESTRPVRLASELNTDGLWVQFSPDGKTVYYTDGDLNLCAASSRELQWGGEPVRIAEEVDSFEVLADGRILYAAYSSSGSLDLFVAGEEDAFCLAHGCDEYQISEDQETLFYTTLDETDLTETLYRMPIAGDAAGEVLLKGASVIYSDWDAETLVYGVEARGGHDEDDRNTLTICACAPGGGETVLVRDVCFINLLPEKAGEVDFYYYIESRTEHTLYDYVTDAKREQDAAILEREPPANPSPGALVAWQEARAWQQASERETLRQMLMDTPRSQTVYDIYHYTGEAESGPILTGVRLSTGAASQKDGLFLYAQENAECPKLMDLADLDDMSELYTLLEVERDKNDGGWRLILGDREAEIELEGVTSIPYLAVLNGEEIVLELDRGDERTLVSYAIEGDTLRLNAVIAEGSFSMPYPASASGRDALYLFTETKQDGYGLERGAFCLYQDGRLETVVSGAYEVLTLENGETYVVTDTNLWTNDVDLVQVTDGEPSAIANGVLRLSLRFLGDGRLLYIRRGDLYLWDGKKERQIAKGVADIWPSAGKAYTAYIA